jgi:hypothetical protein
MKNSKSSSHAINGCEMASSTHAYQQGKMMVNNVDMINDIIRVWWERSGMPPVLQVHASPGMGLPLCALGLTGCLIGQGHGQVRAADPGARGESTLVTGLVRGVFTQRASGARNSSCHMQYSTERHRGEPIIGLGSVAQRSCWGDAHQRRLDSLSGCGIKNPIFVVSIFAPSQSPIAALSDSKEKMAASLEVCSIDMAELGPARGLAELERAICRLLRCAPSRVAAELEVNRPVHHHHHPRAPRQLTWYVQIEGYVAIRNAVLRHAHQCASDENCVYSTVRFPQGGGLVVALEIDGEQCVVTLRWESSCYSDPSDAAAGTSVAPPGNNVGGA